MSKIKDYTEDKKTKMTTGLFTSRTEEWETPWYVFNELDDKFNFDLDVCATKYNRKCERYIDKDMDGLIQDWGAARCWMNPPYGKNIAMWMEKAYKESLAGALVVCLVHSRTDTRWFHDWAMKASRIYFVKGRIKFGDGKQAAPFPSCIIVYSPLFHRDNIYNVPLMDTWRFGISNKAEKFRKPRDFAGGGQLPDENLPRFCEKPNRLSLFKDNWQ